MKVNKERVCQLLDNGVSNMAEIGRQVGCTREYVRQLMSGYYIKKGGRVLRQKEKILSLRRNGYTYKEIAKEIGCHEERIWQVLKKWGKTKIYAAFFLLLSYYNYFIARLLFIYRFTSSKI